MRTINLKVIESKNPGIEIRWAKELDTHRKFCRLASFVIDKNEIFCEKCYRTLLKFCPFCGSTRMKESKFYSECSICKSISVKKFL